MVEFRQPRLGREPSRTKIKIVPAATVILGSIVTAMPIITDYPILPPMGFLVLLAWRFIRPGYWPVWAAFPLGLVDDIFSGQPVGSAVFLWSVIFIVLESIDRRAVTRDYWQDWLLASVAIIFVLTGGMLIIDFQSNLLRLDLLVPQMLLSILIYPFVARLIGAIDAWRLSA